MSLRVNLAPNEAISFDNPAIKYPLLASPKFDGMRCLIYDGVMYSRNAKPLKKLLQEKFFDLCDISKRQKLVFDGELYTHDVENFGQVMSLLTKGDKAVPDHVKFFCFDCVRKLDWDMESGGEFFQIRDENLKKYVQSFALTEKGVVHVPQTLVTSPEILGEYVERFINDGYEGAITKYVRSRYKHGRGTVKEGNIFKFKEWNTADAIIIGFEQGTRMLESVKTGERTRNDLGYLERTSKASTRESVDAIGSINVRLDDGTEVGCGIAKGSDVVIPWSTRESFIGKGVEIRFMSHGVKEKPRFARLVRFRPDKDA